MADDDETGSDPSDQAATAARARANRMTMVQRLLEAGTIRSDSVAGAMTAVARHRFVEDSTVDEAYADDAIIVKRDPDGTAISSASQPTMVAAMLEMCRLAPGHRVLEIGTGTGYNAALLADLVGSDGLVLSIELDPELAAAARRRLAGLDHVEVITGDAVSGYPANAPYDRVIATTGAPGIAPAWIDQLVDGGRLVVPVVGADGIGAVSCQVNGPDGLREVVSLPCGFLPMRSA
ncbi:MAG: methyltransferase domain-containing protein [Actinomycetota bacterium]